METGSESRSPSFPVGVIMQRTNIEGNPWLDARWTAKGIIVQEDMPARVTRRRIKEDGPLCQYLWTGFDITLYIDQAESYYHNLMMNTPGIFVVCRMNAKDEPEPFLVTASCDEANAYVETDEVAYSVAFPPEFYEWIERFVLQHYVPEKKVKRKLKSWKNRA